MAHASLRARKQPSRLEGPLYGATRSPWRRQVAECQGGGHNGSHSDRSVESGLPVFYPRQYNAAADLVDRHIWQGRCTKIAFIDPARSLTYGGLAAESNQAANLMQTLGLRQEERIACVLQDTCDYPVIFWGAVKAGIVPVALNTLLTPDQLRYILEDSRARVLFVSAPLLSAVQPILAGLPSLDRVVVVGEGGDYEAKRAAQSAEFT